jgi:phospholipase C
VNYGHSKSIVAAFVASAVMAAGFAAPALADIEAANRGGGGGGNNAAPTKTPIKHVVIIFGENESFDHYFATYPNAKNTEQPIFRAASDTPAVNGLSAGLLTHNPNLFNPKRLGREDAYTCSFNHDYTAEQKAADGGLLDKFVQATSRVSEGCATDGSTVLDYYDGNTVTALWNYAQHYSMNDNSFDTNFGPSTVGAINLVSGQTGNGHLATSFAAGKVSGFKPVTVTGDPDPALDDCGADAGGTASGKGTVEMEGRNVGDLLNLKGVTWGWFEGGFAATSPAVVNSDGSTKTPAQCASSHIQHQYSENGRVLLTVPNPTINPGADIHVATADYSPHHAPFQYYASTRNPHHLPPKNVAEIGHSGQANHNYDLTDFYKALAANNLPAVSYLKAAKYQDAHPGNSDPLTEQVFLVQVINAIQQSSAWKDTAVFIQYDDSDGWYDHVNGPIVNPSANASGVDDDNTNANDSFVPAIPLSTSTAPANSNAIPTSGICGSPSTTGGGLSARCGYGPRLPFLVISPWAKQNYVDHTTTDQSSSLRFIEQNWGLEYIEEQTPAAGAGSFDRQAGSIQTMFDFDGNNPENRKLLILDPLTGTAKR